MWDYFIAAFALVLVFEGILPFLCPRCWRNSVGRLLQLNDKLLRAFGLVSMLVGVLILTLLTDFS